MQLEVGVPCVDYADFLKLTLPQVISSLRTLSGVGQITLLTTARDTETCSLAERCGVRTWVTDAWYANGASFNKARALNEWIDNVLADSENCWILTLDADIFIPIDLFSNVRSLNPRALYGVPRRACRDEREWNDFMAGRRSWESFPIISPPVIDGKLWGHRPTRNATAISGYFQLWNPSGAQRRFKESADAADYDVAFALSFGDSLRKRIPSCEVMHLGQQGVNWRGRRSPEWSSAIKGGRR